MILEDILPVKFHRTMGRRQVLRSSRAGVSLVTPFLDDLLTSEAVSGDCPWLCFVRFGLPSRTVDEVRASLDGLPFESAGAGRLLDFCRDHPKMRFEYPILFIGSSCQPVRRGEEVNGFPCLWPARDGSRQIRTILDLAHPKFGPSWRFALQPASPDVVDDLLYKLITEEESQAILV